MDMYVRRGSPHGAGDIDVEVAVHFRRQSGLKTNLRSAQIHGLASAANDLFNGQKVALSIAIGAAEGAKAAVFRADVREIDVAIDDVGDHVAGLAAAHLVGHKRHDMKVSADRLAEPQRVLPGNFVIVQHPPEDAADFGIRLGQYWVKRVGCHTAAMRSWRAFASGLTLSGTKPVRFRYSG